ncbi:DUF3298 domain-containing protein [Paenibacillus sp. NPDC058071]|uniref:DUF3298 domain-containing protein n=1 Tax=Paenibacillus sp. NPDC058071 TaxID=3346326 RepID=UPI0036D87E07
MQSTFKTLALSIAGSCLLAISSPVISAAGTAPSLVASAMESTVLSASGPAVSYSHASVSAVPTSSLLSAVRFETPYSTVIGSATSSAVQLSSNASKSNSAVTVSSRSVIEKEGQYGISVKIPVIAGMEDSAYEKRLNEEIALQVKQEIEVLKEQAAEEVKYAKESGYEPHLYELKVDYDLKSDGSKANGSELSFVVRTYTYTGGNHGLYRVDTYNVYNGEHASDITLETVLGADYKEQVERVVKAEMKADPERFYEGIEKELNVTSDHPFYIKNGKLVLVFQQYEIAPYSAGIIEITVPATGIVEPTPPVQVHIGQQGKGTGTAVDGYYLLTGHGDRLVPLRVTMEKAGYSVHWYQKENQAEVSRLADFTVVKPGVDAYFLNKKDPISIGIAPVVIAGHLYVPSEFFSEVMNLPVKVEKDTGMLIIG